MAMLVSSHFCPRVSPWLTWGPRSSRSFSRFRARLAERGRVHWLMLPGFFSWNIWGNTGNVKFIVSLILSWNSWHVFNIFSICFHPKKGWLNCLQTGGCCTVPPQWSRIPRDAREQRGMECFMQLQFIGFSRGIFHNEDPLQKSHFSRDSLENQESFFGMFRGSLWEAPDYVYRGEFKCWCNKDLRNWIKMWMYGATRGCGGKGLLWSLVSKSLCNFLFLLVDV